LKEFGEVFVRANEGLDAGAHKEAILRVGFDKLAEYDEIVLLNDTLFGPIYPLALSFEKMAKKNVDFWGLTKYYHENVPEIDDNDDIKYSITEHLSSAFVVCRSNLVKSPEFARYWEELPAFKSYEDVLNDPKIDFALHFSNLGYKWGVAVDTDKIQHPHLTDGLLQYPVELIASLGCPVFSRRLFFAPPSDYLDYSLGDAPFTLLKYIQEFTDYNTDLVYKHIIRTANLYTLTKNLALFKALPKHFVKSADLQERPKVALIVHSYFTDLVPYLLNYASNMPDDADIYFTTGSAENAREIQQQFDKMRARGDFQCGKFEVRIIKNRGRDVSALLIGGRDLVDKYDLICSMHDKKSKYLKPASIGETWSDKLFECNLASKQFVQNLINQFVQDKFLGMTFPFLPFHANFFPIFDPAIAWNTDGSEHGNHSKVVDLLKRMGIDADLDKDLIPVCPLGTMFWFRSSALQKLFALNWKYDDFPPEPNKLDGTVLHAVERSYALVAQGAGFYSAFVMPDTLAGTEYNALTMANNCINEAILGAEVPPKSLSYEKLLVRLKSRFNVISRIRQFYRFGLRILVKIYHTLIGKRS
jgi:rhamnosyltransferase